MTYLRRAVDRSLDELLPYAPAILCEGPKAVGKTRTASQRAKHVLSLDREEDWQRLRADPSFAGFGPGTILVDEWQTHPESWTYARHRIDAGVEPGRFIFAGSSTPKAGVDLHSGAGRLIALKMRPMAIFERAALNPPGELEPTVSMRALLSGDATIGGESTWELRDYVAAIEQSGFPAIAEAPQSLRPRYLASYLERVVDRDLPEQGFSVRNRESLLAWLRAYAAASSTDASYTAILNAATPGDAEKPARSTTRAYRDLLAEQWLVDPVRAWSAEGGALSRLSRSPKHQLADPALAVSLMRIPRGGLLKPRHSHLLGPLFESLATLSVRAAAEAAAAGFVTVGHLRTRNGDHEVDLVVEGPEGQVLAIEVKLAVDITDGDVRHLVWLRDKLPDDVVDTVVLSAGKYAYRRADGVAVVPLALLGA